MVMKLTVDSYLLHMHNYSYCICQLDFFTVLKLKDGRQAVDKNNTPATVHMYSASINCHRK